MPDTNNQTISNPQDLVDAALGSASEPVRAPEPVVQTVPPAPLPPLSPLSTEEVKPESVVASVPNNTVMGDDTPLAFAMPAPSTQAPIPPTQQSSYLPPVAPAPTNTNVGKPKKKVGLVIGGILLLVMALGGGVWGYQKYNTTAQIAYVKSDTPEANALAEAKRIAKAAKQNGKSEKEAKDLATIAAKKAASDTVKMVSEQLKLGSEKDIKQIAADMACGTDAQCISDIKSGTINDAVQRVGEETIKKDFVQTGIDNAVNLEYAGVCLAGDTGCPTSCSNVVGFSNYKYPTKEPGGGKYCDDQGRQCSKYRNEMMLFEVASTPGNEWCFVDYGEQCGEAGSCGPGSNTVDTPSSSPSPSPSPSPAMACTGLTYVPATTPVIGTVLTFTCAGTITPTTAGTLSYKYRYSINSGVYTTMTNNKLTIAACGTYSVECQTCATIAGVLTCDPIWTGATQ